MKNQVIYEGANTTNGIARAGIRSNIRMRRVRNLSTVIIALLLLQFLLGMWTNLFAEFPAKSASVNPLDSIFTNGPYVMTAHIVNGLVLGILSIVVVALSALSRSKQALALAIAGLASLLFAGESGISFVLGWYGDDLLSFMMASGLALSLAFYFTLLLTVSKNRLSFELS